MTPKAVLDNAMAMITDNSDDARAKLLIWLNMGVASIAAMRNWSFLSKTATITLTNGAGVWPADFAESLSYTIGTSCIYPAARLSDRDLAESRYGGTYDYRVRETSTGFTIYPSADSCELVYKIDVPTYTDNTATMVFPDEFMELLFRYCIVKFYEFDFDERTPGAGMLYDRALKDAKAWDNRQRGLPRREQRSILWSNT